MAEQGLGSEEALITMLVGRKLPTDYTNPALAKVGSGKASAT